MRAKALERRAPAYGARSGYSDREREAQGFMISRYGLKYCVMATGGAPGDRCRTAILAGGSLLLVVLLLATAQSLMAAPLSAQATESSRPASKSASKSRAAKKKTSAAGASHADGHSSRRSSKSASSVGGSAEARSHSSSGRKIGRSSRSVRSKSHSRVAARRLTPAERARTIKLRSAFTASSQLRPMAQQLAATRTPAAYAGVLNYAQTHTGEASAAAYLALGHAYLLDRRFDEAARSFHVANVRGDALHDYADYLEAQADLQGGRGNDADAILEGFSARHPDSIFTPNVPVMLASAYLQQGNPEAALRVLAPLANQERATHADYLYALGRAYQLCGKTTEAAVVYRKLYLTQPLSGEAANARVQMQAIGAPPLTLAERRAHADKLFSAKRYAEASESYHGLAREAADKGDPEAASYQVYAAASDFKLKKLKKAEAERLPDSNGDAGALRLYLLAELARNDNDFVGNSAAIEQLKQRFPNSRWLNEALYSAANMYMLKRDYAQAIGAYAQLVSMFPESSYAPSSHWREAWLNYRLRNYAEAARLCDEQIERYEGGIEIPNALYWRGRIYEDEERNIGQAENYYRALAGTYPNYYYALLARQRLASLPAQSASPTPVLAHVHPLPTPDLTDQLPADDIHLIKARLLANAALNEYIAAEIQASPDSAEWGVFGQAQIYASYGEYSRALQTMKQAKVSFFALPVNEVPLGYWHLLFPQAYWPSLLADAGKNGLDPYLVASLIRQESEFNPGVVSYANAYGLMQLLPSVGKQMARKEGDKHFSPSRLLDPQTNLDLGTENLRVVLNKFGGQVEYALAAYNAGDERVREWESSGDYKDMPEFVESIPFTQTRDYVQAILRNREMYRLVYTER